MFFYASVARRQENSDTATAPYGAAQEVHVYFMVG